MSARLKIFIIALCTFVVLPLTAQASNNILNIYIWSSYIPDDVIHKFEEQTGIKVNLSEYDSNETLYTKLKTAPNAGYDLIVPSSYFVERMRNEHMLEKINKDKLHNFKYLNRDLLNKSFDPHNNYSVPYFWGATGIVVNKKYINPKTITKWADLWQPRFKNKLLMLNDMREVFGIAFITLHYSVNDTNPQHIQQAYIKIKELMPNIMLFNSDAEQNIYIDEDSVIGMGWSGDVNLARQENPNLVFIYPQDGFGVWVDCLAIVKNAPHLENAYKFLNFILSPSIAKEISVGEGYSTSNSGAMKLLQKKIRDNKTIYPDKETLKRGMFQGYIGRANIIYTKYWNLLKLGG